MAFIYTRADLKSLVNSEIHNRSGMLVSEDNTINRGVRALTSKVDLRSTRRKSTLSPNLFNDVFWYTCPTDLDAFKIIDVPAQAKRSDGEFNLIPPQEFATNHKRGDIAIKDYNESRVLLIDSAVDSKSIVVAELDGLTSGSSDGT
jgi:hypothetical protein